MLQVHICLFTCKTIFGINDFKILFWYEGWQAKYDGESFWLRSTTENIISNLNNNATSFYDFLIMFIISLFFEIEKENISPKSTGMRNKFFNGNSNK